MIANEVKLNIAILGATSHIAQSLAYEFNKINEGKLYLFSREPNKINKNIINNKTSIATFDYFKDFNYDIIINCVQVPMYSNDLSEVFLVSELFDNLIIEKILNKKSTIYFYLSSGAVYNEVNVNTINDTDFYSIQKRYIEAKHRSLKNFNIVDLRLFSYFSRFATIRDHYFIDQAINCVKNKQELITDFSNMTRDFVHSSDLARLILCCVNKEKINDFFDVYSSKPITKFDLMEFFVKEYNLKCKRVDSIITSNHTGIKKDYYPLSLKAATIGYIPQYTSEETIRKEIKFLIN